MSEHLDKITRFMEAGGSPSWDEWDAMDLETQAAFVAVARIRRVEDAARNGLASSGPRGVLEVVAEIDGGEALEEALMRQAVVAIKAAATSA
jgi:hypothetical protein